MLRYKAVAAADARAKFWRRQLLGSKSKHRLADPPPAPCKAPLFVPPKAPGLSLTWAEVQQRCPTACRHCAFHFASHGVPCLAHTLPDERAARSRAIGATR